MSPAIRFESPSFSASARASAWRVSDSWQLASGDVHLAGRTPLAWGTRLEFTGNASHVAWDPVTRNDQVEARARIHRMFSQRGGIWVEGGLERPMRVALVSAVAVSAGGAWTKIGGATLSGTVSNYAFNRVQSSSDSSGVATCAAGQEVISGGIPTASTSRLAGSEHQGAGCRRQSRFSDLEGALGWVVGPLEIEARGGYRLGEPADVPVDSRRWGAASATWWLSSDVAAVVGGGRQPGNPARGLPARSFANLGLMLAYWPLARHSIPQVNTAIVTSFVMRDAGYSHRTLTLRVAGVETVEVMGDFTDWEPRALNRLGRDLWEITLPIMPGIHQVNVRLDKGKWRPPPGMPSMRDGFNGDVGILVVDEDR
ncbi:MAG TPA: glycogen-binding domain-containing protein [Gemmatimonadaceae bacterium]